MKTRMLFLVVLIMVVLLIAGSCATGKKAYVTQEDEELYVAWINTEYDFRSPPAKVVYHPDGTLEVYWTTKSNNKIDGTSRIIEKWTEDEGNIW